MKSNFLSIILALLVLNVFLTSYSLVRISDISKDIIEAKQEASAVNSTVGDFQVNIKKAGMLIPDGSDYKTLSGALEEMMEELKKMKDNINYISIK